MEANKGRYLYTTRSSDRQEIATSLGRDNSAITHTLSLSLSLSLADPWLRHRTQETGSRRHAVYCRDLCEKMDVTWSMTLTPAAPGPDPSPARGINTEVPGSNSITMPVIQPRVSAYTHVVATRKVLACGKNNFASARRDNHI